MAEKFFTISFDDGLEQDRRIITLMEKYGIKGTFNLCSGMFGKKGYVKRIGNIGYRDVEKPGFPKCCYTEHFALEEAEAVKLYSSPNVEVASHGTHHRNQDDLTETEAEEEITQDVRRLSELFGYQIQGHAFPYNSGSTNPAVIAALQKNGIRYARKISMSKKPKDFYLNRNKLILIPSCWQLDYFSETLLQKFLEMPVAERDLVFYMWGHGYELDFRTKRGNIEHLEHMFQMVSKAKNICCVTNAELYRNGSI